MEGDSARILIRRYEESEWRTTRLEVVRALGRISDHRALPFLISLIRKNEDLAEQNLAILSLARQRSRGAKLFLRSFYSDAPAALRPVLAHALGLAQVHESSGGLLADWDSARKAQDPLWLKNIILALGELKEFGATRRIHEFLQSSASDSQDLVLACLFSLGRLERDPARLRGLESMFSEDSVLWHVYQSTLAQVQIRGQFKLEDYLSKIFESDDPHPLMPFELRAFSEKDLEAGLELFPMAQFWRRHLLCLRALPSGLRTGTLDALLSLGAAPGSAQPEFWAELFGEISRIRDTGFTSTEAGRFFSAMGGEGCSPDLRLLWVDAFLPAVAVESEARVFLAGTSENDAIGFLNLWGERSLGEGAEVVKRNLKNFLASAPAMSDGVFSRLLRAAAELGVGEKSLDAEAEKRWSVPGCRGSILVYAEALLPSWAAEKALELTPSDPALLTRGLGVLWNRATQGRLAGLGNGTSSRVQENIHAKIQAKIQSLLSVLNQPGSGELLDLQVALFRLMAVLPDPSFEPSVLKGLSSENPNLRLQAVIAAKAYPASRPISEALAEVLSEVLTVLPTGEPAGGPEVVLQGRALDSILAHTTLVAKRAAMGFLKSHIGDEFVVDKVYRDFDPEKKGGAELHEALEALLKECPNHPQWEKLVALRDRLKPKEGVNGVASGGAQGAIPGTASSPEVLEIDERLSRAIPKFDGLHPAAKLALRAAEQPFLQAEGVSLPIDKAPIVLEFCKALDLLLERELGQKHLFPRLDRELHAFQTAWHRAGFGEDYPNPDRVLQALGLKGRISPELFPLHKAKLMSATFFNGKILQDRFKVFDGLRAWAVIFLIFARKLPEGTASRPGAGAGPLFKLEGLNDEQCVQTAKRLMQLQDLRNPAAHRQTYSDLQALAFVREETIQLINLILSG